MYVRKVICLQFDSRETLSHRLDWYTNAQLLNEFQQRSGPIETSAAAPAGRRASISSYEEDLAPATV
jgi:hypothetical protein